MQAFFIYFSLNIFFLYLPFPDYFSSTKTEIWTLFCTFMQHFLNLGTFSFFSPDRPLHILEPENPSIAVSDLHKLCVSPDLWAPKLWKGRSGSLVIFTLERSVQFSLEKVLIINCNLIIAPWMSLEVGVEWLALISHEVDKWSYT